MLHARWLRKLGSLLLITGMLSLMNLGEAMAQTSSQPMIFDVRRSLPLEPGEPMYHDFYINAGPEAGFRKGLYMTVVRALPIHDPIQNKQQATLNINVGRLQIIHVEKGITVARMNSEFTDEERPTLEFESIMIGDRIDLASLTSEAPKTKGKAKARSAEAKPAPVVKAEVVAEAAPVAPAVQPAVSEDPALVPPNPTAVSAPDAAKPAAPKSEIPSVSAPIEEAVPEMPMIKPSQVAPRAVASTKSLGTWVIEEVKPVTESLEPTLSIPMIAEEPRVPAQPRYEKPAPVIVMEPESLPERAAVEPEPESPPAQAAARPEKVYFSGFDHPDF